jgi:pantetheine-phosphate adenylyltransferase
LTKSLSFDILRMMAQKTSKDILRYDMMLELESITGFPLSILLDVFECYDEPHRFYHNNDHILDLILKIFADRAYYVPAVLQELVLTALYHDIYYDPKNMHSVNPSIKSNEQRSAERFRSDAQTRGVKLSSAMERRIYKNIQDTEKHVPRSETSVKFCKYDLSGFGDISFSKVLAGEKKIQKEYQWVDWNEYLIAKSKILRHFRNHPLIKDTANAVSNIDRLSQWIDAYEPKIAVYAGSFNPFHIGHLNILEKAERIFDKVIIAKGYNSEKGQSQTRLPSNLFYRQTEDYPKTLVEYVHSKPYPVTIIRGLRNTSDMQYELNQYHWLQLLDKNIQVVSIFCDVEYQHISSSTIRKLKEGGYDAYDEKLGEYTVK